MGVAARRPLAVALIVCVVALAGAALALRLTPSAATESLVGRSSDSYAATHRGYERFGQDAVYVLVRGNVSNLVLTSDLERLLGLEGCISGNAPADAKVPGGPDGPCGRLARDKPVKVVIGPGTFINESIRQITEQFTAQTQAKSKEADAAGAAAYKLARGKGYSKARAERFRAQAKQLVTAQYLRDTITIALRYGITKVPQLNDTAFVSQLVFDPAKTAGTPKARFAYLFPNARSSLVQVRLRAGLSEAESRRAIALVREAIAMPQWRLAGGGQYVVTGAPVVVNDLTSSISRSIGVLLVAALLVMALTLALVFRARLRMLPLVVALAATAIVFGALSLIGASLTMASIGVLPVLIGLAVDYAIQLQSRLQEGVAPLRDRVRAVAAEGAPTVAVAAAATAAGFLVLVLSPVPMVRGFGLLLVAGIAVALVVALTLGTAVQALAGRRAPGRRARTARLARAGAAVAPALRGAGELLRDNAGSRAVASAALRLRDRSLLAAGRRPARVVAVALAVAALGWALDTQTRVESDVTKLVPQNLPALADLEALQQSTGVGGQIDVVVSSDRLTDPAVVRWMTRYQGDLLQHFGYDEKRRGCGKAELCAAFSLPDLFREGGATSRAQVEQLLDAVPPYFSQSVITADRRTATLAFGIRLMPLDRQQQVIEEMRRRLHPPAGVTAQLAGLPVLAAEANHAVSSPWRRALTLLAGLVAVALVLLAALRSWRRALVPLVPIALATGWSSLVLFALRVPLNPMSVTLGALVIAISTEFSVLLAERYRAERRAGHDPASALERTYRSTGAAVLASGATAIAGFAVLMLSDIRMLRDFGAVTVVDLSVSLVGVLVVLPSVLLLDERGRLPARLRAALARGRRRNARAAAA
jgi:hypothetical protein